MKKTLLGIGFSRIVIGVLVICSLSLVLSCENVSLPISPDESLPISPGGDVPHSTGEAREFLTFENGQLDSIPITKNYVGENGYDFTKEEGLDIMFNQDLSDPSHPFPATCPLGTSTTIAKNGSCAMQIDLSPRQGNWKALLRWHTHVANDPKYAANGSSPGGTVDKSLGFWYHAPDGISVAPLNIVAIHSYYFWTDCLSVMAGFHIPRVGGSQVNGCAIGFWPDMCNNGLGDVIPISPNHWYYLAIGWLRGQGGTLIVYDENAGEVGRLINVDPCAYPKYADAGGHQIGTETTGTPGNTVTFGVTWPYAANGLSGEYAYDDDIKMTDETNWHFPYHW
jgi:hypothetical protein